MRFTVRRMMTAVAVIAVALGPVAHLKRRCAAFRKLAALHASQVAGYTIDDGGFEPLFLDRDGLPVSRREGERDLWHGSMNWKYDQATLRPWVPVPPDPPEPDWGQYSDVSPRPRRLPTISEELRRQANRTRALRDMARQSRHAGWPKQAM